MIDSCRHGDPDGCRTCADEARREAFAGRPPLTPERRAAVLATQQPRDPAENCAHQQLDPDCPVCWEYIDEGEHWRRPDGTEDPDRHLSRRLDAGDDRS